MWPLAQDYGRVAKTWLDSDHEKERGRGRADAGSLSKREEPVAPEPSVDYDSNDHGTGPKGKKKGLSRTSPSKVHTFLDKNLFYKNRRGSISQILRIS